MLMALIAFELRYHAKQAVFRIACLVFLAGGLLMSQAGYGGPGLLRNAPYAVIVFAGLFSLGAVIPIALFAGGAILRDRECGMEDIVYASNLTHAQYVVSRFAGLVLASFLVFSAAVAGLFLGNFLPWADPARFGPVNPWAYLWALLALGLPNALWGSALVFAAAALTRNAMATYISGILIFMLYWLGSALGNSPLMAGASYLAPEQAALAALLEPCGLVGFLEQTRYWSVLQKNTELPALAGVFLLNRMFWTGLALSIFALTYRLFSFRSLPGVKRAKPVETGPEADAPATPYRPVAPRAADWGRALAAFVSQARMLFRTAVNGYPFYALLLLWLCFVGLDLHQWVDRGELNAPYAPLTGLLLPRMAQPMLALGALAVVFFAGELAWRERRCGMADLLDAAPCANGVFWAAKCVALTAVVATLVAATILAGMAVQAFHGFFAWDLGLYASLFVRVGLPLALIGVLALAIQTFSPNKYAGLAIGFALIMFFSGVVLPRSPGIEHPMLRFGYTPELIYSPMAGAGYHDPAMVWFLVYWCGVAGLIGVATLMFWRRGTGLRRQRLGTGGRLLAGASLAVLLIGGGALVYRLHIAGDYRTSRQREAWRASYERTYGPFSERATPTIVEAALSVDLYPRERRFEARGNLTIENQTAAPLTDALLGLAPGVAVRALDLAGAALQREDRDQGHYVFAFDPPLAPGARRRLQFDIAVRTSSFGALDPERYVTPRASYVELHKSLPFFGFDVDRALDNPDARRRQGLPESPPSPETPRLAAQRDWVRFDAVVSTEPEQTVVAPGVLVRRWEEDGRALFHYRSAGETGYGLGVASAAYQAESLAAGGVTVTVYTAPGHGRNLERVFAAAADTLDYGRANFGAFPHEELKIAELPSFSDRFGGTSYPSALFGVENRLFLVRQEPEAVDVAYRVIAHETAHQWWGGLLDPMPGDGARMLTEFLAVYTEMAVVAADQPRDRRQYLDLTNDLYFYFRGFEQDTEPPLARVGFQPYVYYFKGPQAVHALVELIGEASVNQVLRGMLRDFAYPRKAAPEDLAARLLAAAPPEARPLLDEWLNQVAVYDLSVLSAESRPGEGGGVEIGVEIQALRTAIDADGREEKAPPAWVELGLWRGERLLRIERIPLEAEAATVSVVADEAVDAVSLDPRRLRLDANRGDNRRAVEASAAFVSGKPAKR